MDISIIYILVAVLVVGGIFWLVMSSRKQGQKHIMQTSIKPQETREKDSGV